jgi:hypothetical protein
VDAQGSLADRSIKLTPSVLDFHTLTVHHHRRKREERKPKMKWFRKKKKSQSVDAGYHYPSRFDPAAYPPPPTTSVACIARLPAPLLERVFALVCPHARDETYETCEQSAVEDTCMLCDLRDLAHCVQVSRRWRKLAANVL